MLNRRALAPWRLVVLMALALIAPLFVANLAYADPTAAPGWAVAPLITGFTTSTPCPNSDCYGPVGSAFSPSGDLWVEDYPSGYIYRWDAGTLPQAPATTSVSAANFSANNSPSGDGVFALAFGGDGRLWATYTSFSTSKVVQLGTSGANAGLIIQTLTNESSKANRLNGIAVDPLSGDIFVSVVSSPGRIDRINPDKGKATTYATVNGTPDGLTFGPDGTLYVVSQEDAGCNYLTAAVLAIGKTTGPQPAPVSSPPVCIGGADGLAVAANNSYLASNNTDGSITTMPLPLNPNNAPTTIVGGGSRGDLTVVGPDGCLYATQSDEMLRVTNADGTCSFAPTLPPPPPPPPAHCGSSSNPIAATAPSTSGTFLAVSQLPKAANNLPDPTAQNAVLDTSDACSPSGSKVTTGATAQSVSSVCAYVGPVDPTAQQNQFSTAVYADAGGQPGALLVNSPVGTLTANSWNCLPVSTTLQPSTSYWLMMWSNSCLGSSSSAAHCKGAAYTNDACTAASPGADTYDNLCKINGNTAGTGAYWTPAALTSFGDTTWPSSLGSGSWTVTKEQYYIAATVTSSGSNPPPATTLGNTSQGGSTDTGDSGYMNGSRFVMGSQAGPAGSISVYVAGPIGGANHSQYELAIYTDNNGEPGTLVASSISGTLIANSWNTLPISATLNANTAYWLMYNTNGNNSSVNNMTYITNGSGQSAYSKPTTFGTWPASFGSATNEAGPFSIYVTYTPQ